MRINGIPLDDLVKLEADIIKDFGSLSIFSKATTISYDKMRSIFNKSEFTKEHFHAVKAVYDKHMEERVDGDRPFKITKRERKAIRITILTHYYNYTEFCKEYPQYDVVYITNIVRGNIERKTLKYRRLLRFLENTYELKIKEYER